GRRCVVDQDAQSARVLDDLPVHSVVAGRREGQRRTREIAASVRAQSEPDPAFSLEPPYVVACLGSDAEHVGLRVEQAEDLALGNRAAPDDDGSPFSHVEDDGIHRTCRLRTCGAGYLGTCRALYPGRLKAGTHANGSATRG